MWNAVPCVAHIVRLLPSNVEMYPEKNILETLGGIVHASQLKPLLIEEGFGESAAKRIRWQCAFLRELQLRKQFLERKEKFIRRTTYTHLHGYFRPISILD